MHLTLPDSATAFQQSHAISLPTGPTQFWPEEQPLKNLNDPQIFGTVFQDAHLWHNEAIALACQAAENLPPNYCHAGGKKVRDHQTWGLAGLQLTLQRALIMFCRVHQVAQAHITDRWINVMKSGDYSSPHCHYDAQSALVYALDPGDVRPAEPWNGGFDLQDPRIAACCPYQPARPIRSLSPEFRPGLMILFPAEYLHFVHPYHGNRPRLTIALNISAGPPPTDRVIDPSQSVSVLSNSFTT